MNIRFSVAVASTAAAAITLTILAPDAAAKKKPKPPVECPVDTNIRTADPALLKRFGMLLEGCEDRLLIAPADPSEYEDPENVSVAASEGTTKAQSEYAYNGDAPRKNAPENAEVEFADLDKVTVSKKKNEKQDGGNRVFYYSKTSSPTQMAGTGVAVSIVPAQSEETGSATPVHAAPQAPAKGGEAIFNMRPQNYQTKFDQLIAQAAQRHRIDPLLLHAVIKQESGYRSKAVSHAGAAGLMQLMPATGRGLGVRPNERFDPAKNIDAGARLLRRLWFKYDGNIDLMLAAYNAGEGAVAKYGNRVPPYRETQNYVRSINAHYNRLLAKQRPEALKP